MKQLYFFMIVLFCMPVSAIETVLTSSIHIAEVANSNMSHTPIDIPTTIPRRVQFKNRVNTYPELDIALTAAEYIFSKEMKNMHIDLVTMNVEVVLGYADEFNLDEVCKVSVYYVDSLTHNINYTYFNSYESNIDDIPILVPKSIANQSRGIPLEGACMQIKLNPNIPYHFETSAVPEDKYDAITILLRALVIGCGIQSSLEPDMLQFGIYHNGQMYMNAFDTHIYNDLGQRYSSVVNNFTSIYNFLAGRSVYAEGGGSYGDPMINPIYLYNDWEVYSNESNVTSSTLNTINPLIYTEEENTENFYDLLDPFFNTGTEQRTITKYSKALLCGLGWIYNIPVGLDYNYTNVDNCVLCCSNTILYQDQSYHVWPSTNASLSNIVCELESSDSTYVIAEGNNFSFHSIPSNVQWKRNPITKNIIGKIRATAYLYDGNIIEREKILNIEIPYQPNKPIIQKSENTTDGNLTLNINGLANGSNMYTITYTGVTYGDTHTFTTSTDILDTTLTNIPGNQLYNLSVYGTNAEGNSDTYNATFGFSTRPVLNMTVSVLGNILKYDLSNNGTIDLSDVVISSVQIVDRSGVVWLSPTACSGDPINISSLNRGFYILKVVADDRLYSRLFIKR